MSTSVIKGVGLGVRILRMFMALDPRSREQKAAGMRARAERLKLAAIREQRTLERLAHYANEKRAVRRYSRRVRRLHARARWWYAQADRLDPPEAGS